MNTRAIALVVLALAMVGAASATTYRWTWTSVGHVNGAQPGGGNLFYNAAGGGIDTVTAEFTPSTNRLKFDVSFDNTDTNSYWLAMSPGDNPKGHSGELALFYMDASSSSPVVTAYAYNGQNADNSYRDGSGTQAGNQTPDFILSSTTNPAAFSQITRTDAGGKRTLTFDMDASAINNHVPLLPGPLGPSEWTGSEFANKFGIWFHQQKNAQYTYDSTGRITNFTYGASGWLDGDNLQTVPEPATMAALGLGLAAIARKRRAK